METSEKYFNNKKIEDDNEKNKQKRPFIKKEYRLKKYSNKYKVEKWEERRKKAVMRQYYKDLSKDEQNALKLKSKFKVENDSNVSKPKFNAFEKAKKERLRKKEEEAKKKEEIIRKKAEKEEALERYKQKKLETYKKLSKKTKKGQPVMKDRMEMLLEKIQQSV